MTVWVGLHSKLAQLCVEKSIISWIQVGRILRSSWRKPSLIMQTSSFIEAPCRDCCQPKKVKERFTCPFDRNYPPRYQFSVSSVSGCSWKMFSHIFVYFCIFGLVLVSVVLVKYLFPQMINGQGDRLIMDSGTWSVLPGIQSQPGYIESNCLKQLWSVDTEP